MIEVSFTTLIRQAGGTPTKTEFTFAGDRGVTSDEGIKKKGMKSRELYFTRRVFQAFIGSAGFAWSQPSISEIDQWKKDIDGRWSMAEVYTLDVLEAMPSQHLQYVAFEGEYSFIKHLTHLGYYNAVLVASIKDGPFKKPAVDLKAWTEPENPTKEDAREYLKRTFDHARKLCASFTTADLERNPVMPFVEWRGGHKGRDMVWRAITHTFHHRAQAIVYLRGKGIKPPPYRF
jgi:uncharacterized damage-inducible protein DinB